jgi:hypothetical protein
MAATSLQRELTVLVLEQIHALKQEATLNEHDIFEYHLRHYQIMVLYGQLDRTSRPDDAAASHGWFA